MTTNPLFNALAARRDLWLAEAAEAEAAGAHDCAEVRLGFALEADAKLAEAIEQERRAYARAQPWWR